MNNQTIIKKITTISKLKKIKKVVLKKKSQTKEEILKKK